MGYPALTDRMEIRTEPWLSRDVAAYCKKHKMKRSDLIREAIQGYLEQGTFKKLLVESLDSMAFRRSIKEFMKNSPMPISLFFENLLGPDEVSHALASPAVPQFEQFFITDMGRQAFRNRLGKE